MNTIKFDPKLEGITHINGYSKSRTNLGIMISNFSEVDIHHPNLGFFKSIEGLWFWLLTKDDRLRFMFGHKAKEFGQRLPRIGITSDSEYFKKTIREALWIKILCMPGLKSQLEKCELPIVHYYVRSDSNGNEYSIPIAEHDWVWKSYEEFRDCIKNKCEPNDFSSKNVSAPSIQSELF
jgi:hypothetical protein